MTERPWDDGWRKQLWEYLMTRLPAQVTVNLANGSYAIRDRTLKYIYADDLEPGEADRLVREWAALMTPADQVRFYDRFSIRALTERPPSEGRRLSLYTQLMAPEQPIVRTVAVTCRQVEGMIVEFAFETAYRGMPSVRRGGQPVFQPAEHPDNHDGGRHGQDQLGHKLSVGQAVEGEQPIQQAQSRNLQHNLAQKRKDQGLASHAHGLENAHGQKVDAQKWLGQGEAAQELGTIGNDGFVAHKDGDEEAGHDE